MILLIFYSIDYKIAAMLDKKFTSAQKNHCKLSETDVYNDFYFGNLLAVGWKLFKAIVHRYYVVIRVYADLRFVQQFLLLVLVLVGSIVLIVGSLVLIVDLLVLIVCSLVLLVAAFLLIFVLLLHYFFLLTDVCYYSCALKKIF